MKRVFALLLALVVGCTVFCLPTSAEKLLYTYPSEEMKDNLQSPSMMLQFVGIRPDLDVTLMEQDVDKRYQPGALMRVAMIGYAYKLVRYQHIDMDKTTGTYTLDMFNNYVAGKGLQVSAMKFGETWTVRDLISVCTIQTAADSAVVLATALAGSPEKFVEGLNNFARELGCENSHFTNVIGLNEDGHYMSARDVMTFTRYLLEYPETEKLLQLTSYTVNPLEKGKARSWPTGNEMLRQSSPFFYTYATGGRIGGTLTELNVATIGGKDGYEYIAVVMGAPRKDEDGDPLGVGYADARRLIRWGILNFSYKTLAQKNEPVAKLPVIDAADTGEVIAVPKEDLYTVVDNDVDLSAITRKVVPLKNTLTAPIKAGDEVGTLQLYYDGKYMGSVGLVAGEDVEYSFFAAAWRKTKNFVTSPGFIIVLLIFILAVVAYVVLMLKHNKTRRRKRR